MARIGARTGIVVAAALALAGCAGDLSQQLLKSPDLQTRVMDVIGQNAPLATQMVERLLSADSTRALVVDGLLANGAASQAIMARMAQDRTMVDGILNFAVQDSSMKNHVLTLFQGMQMGQ